MGKWTTAARKKQAIHQKNARKAAGRGWSDDAAGTVFTAGDMTTYKGAWYTCLTPHEKTASDKPNKSENWEKA